MKNLLKDLRYALRGFARNPVFTAVALLSLALGLGANTAIFSLLDRVLLRELPVRAPGELVDITSNGPHTGDVLANFDSDYSFSYPMYRDFRDRAPVFAGVAAWYDTPASLSIGGQTERIETIMVSGNFFDVLGVRTALGRTILPEDARVRGAGPVVVLSHGFWVRRFGADPSILNQKVLINGNPMTVIGVAAKGFQGLSVGGAPDLFVPLTMEAEMLPGRDELEHRRSAWLTLMARLKPGVTRESAEAAMNIFWKPILEEEVKEVPQTRPQVRERFVKRHLTLAPGANGIPVARSVFGAPLAILMALVGLVLLIACANVANLLLARAAGRRKEIAVRLALGAGRGNIVRQMLAESALLSLGGGALGVLVASWSGAALVQLVPFSGFSQAIPTDPDGRVLAFAAVVSILSGLMFGLAPALQASRAEVYATLKDQAASTSSGQAHVRLRKVLVGGQVALSLLLLIGAGLFLRTLQNLHAIDPGFQTDHLISFAIDPPRNGYRKEQTLALFDKLSERLAGLPGVRAAVGAQTALLSGDNSLSSVIIPGREAKETDPSPNHDAIGVGYFSALGTPLLAGREFTRADAAGAHRVAIVNETFARIFFENVNPLGRQFFFRRDKDSAIEIVGVAKDGKYADLREEKQAFIFRPYAQSTAPGHVTFYVRTAQDPENMVSALRQTVRELDASLPVFDVKTVEQQINESVFAERMVSTLSAFFGGLATLLASIGLYGVMSYMVTRRTREIGLRMALGASRGAVLRLVLAEVLLVVGAGIAVALAATIPLARIARSSEILYGVKPNDPTVLAGATLLLLVVAIVAGYVPAARATRVDPVTALRHD
jgi:predicted permease